MTEESLDNNELEEKEAKALEIFRELAPECDEDMQPSFVRYAEDEKKATFYFQCEHRVDFRELVKQLGSKLSIQVEMRQIGQREQACMVGGLGPCGHELCCCRLGGECCHQNATIKMAKNQNLSLNPTKISGMCGRLMCCLRFENDFYKDFKDRAPKINSFVKTPDGDAKVIGQDAIHEIITLRHDEDKPRKIALADLENVSEDEEKKQFVCDDDAWEAADPNVMDLSTSAANVTINTSALSGDDHMKRATSVKLAPQKEVEEIKKSSSRTHRRRRSRTPREETQQTQATASRPGGNSSGTAKRPGGNSSGTSRRARSTSSNKQAKPAAAPIERKAKTERKPRLRRTRTINSGKDE